MNAVASWCAEWQSIISFTFKVSAEARTLEPFLPLPVRPEAPHDGRPAGDMMPRISVADRCNAYSRVRQFCSHCQRVERHTATTVAGHLLELSLRYWMASLCHDIQMELEPLVKYRKADIWSRRSAVEFMWATVVPLFRDNKLEAELRHEVRQVLRSAWAPSYTAPEDEDDMNTRTSHIDGEGSPSLVEFCLAADGSASDCEGEQAEQPTSSMMLHILAAIGRHCFTMERVLKAQFLYLNHNAKGVVTRVFRSTVRELIESRLPLPFLCPRVKCSLDDVGYVAVARETLLWCAQQYLRVPFEVFSLNELSDIHKEISAEAARGLDDASHILALFDLCGLSANMASVLDVIEGDVCGQGGTAASLQVSQCYHRRLEIFANGGRSAGSNNAALAAVSAVTDHLTSILVAQLNRFERFNRAPQRTELLLCDVSSFRVAAMFDHYCSSFLSTTSFLSLVETVASLLLDTFTITPVADGDNDTKRCLAAFVLVCEKHPSALQRAMKALHDCTLKTLTTRFCSIAAAEGGGMTLGPLMPYVSSLIASFTLNAGGEVSPATQTCLSGHVCKAVKSFLAQHEQAVVEQLCAVITKIGSTTASLDPVSGTLQWSEGDEVALLSLLRVVSLLDSKELFVQSYCQVVARKILNGNISDSEDRFLERDTEIISRLVTTIGSAAVAPLTALLRDRRSALQSEDRRKVIEKMRCSSSAVELCAVAELCAARWLPYTVPELLLTAAKLRSAPELFLGSGMGSAASEYEAQCQHVSPSDTRHRNLSWALCCGNVVVLCRYPQGHSVTLQAPPFVAILLSALEAVLDGKGDPGHDKTADFESLASRCACVPRGLVRATLGNLAFAGVIGRKAPNGPYHLLKESTAKLRKIRINPLQLMHQKALDLSASATGATTAATQGGAAAAQVERQRKVEACVMRLMKSTRRITHKDLLDRVETALSPQFSVPLQCFKAAVEELIMKEYMGRADIEGREGYAYIV